MSFNALVSQWEAAQRACMRPELAFTEGVKRYLVGLGPPPGAELASELAAARLSARQSLDRVFTALQQSRESIPVL